MSAEPWNEHRKNLEASAHCHFSGPILPSLVHSPRVDGSSGASGASGLGSPPTSRCGSQRTDSSFNSPSSNLRPETRSSLQQQDRNYLQPSTPDPRRTEWPSGSTVILQSDPKSNVSRNLTMGAGLSSMGPLSSSLPPLPPSRSLTSGPLPMPRELKWQQVKARSPCVDSPPLVMGFPLPHGTAIVNLPTHITSPVPLTLTGEAISVPTGQDIGMYSALPVASYVGTSCQEGGDHQNHAEPTRTTMLGPRVSRTPVFEPQQSFSAPTREV
ncbi:hypothetical protein FALCPG4_018686 [Fusarium falciforme]